MKDELKMKALREIRDGDESFLIQSGSFAIMHSPTDYAEIQQDCHADVRKHITITAVKTCAGVKIYGSFKGGLDEYPGRIKHPARTIQKSGYPCIGSPRNGTRFSIARMLEMNSAGTEHR